MANYVYYATNNNTMLATPPPELLPCNPSLYPHSYQLSSMSHFSGSPPFSLSADDYFMQCSSSLEESPLSSPGSEVGWEEFELMWGMVGCKQSPSQTPQINFHLGSLLQGSNQFVSSYSSEFELEEPPIPDGIKMPQSKGGCCSCCC